MNVAAVGTQTTRLLSHQTGPASDPEPGRPHCRPGNALSGACSGKPVMRPIWCFRVGANQLAPALLHR